MLNRRERSTHYVKWLLARADRKANLDTRFDMQKLLKDISKSLVGKILFCQCDLPKLTRLSHQHLFYHLLILTLYGGCLKSEF